MDRTDDGQDVLAQHHRELQAWEARFRNIIEKNADGVLVVGGDGIIRYVNPAAEALLERTGQQLCGQPFGIPVSPGETTEIDVLRGKGRNRVAEMRVVQTEWEGQVAYLASLRDVTERKQQDEAQRLLAEARRVLAGTLDRPTLLASVVRLAVAYLADWAVIDLEDETQGTVRAAAAHVDPVRADAMQRLVGRPVHWPEAAPELGAVIHTGQAQVRRGPLAAVLDQLADTPDERQLLRDAGALAILLVPLTAHGRTLGALILAAADPGRRYGPLQQTVAEKLAVSAALALDNARLYDEAQDAVRRRDEFLAMLAHELRNPLAPILNAVQVLRLRGLGTEPALQRALGVIERQGRHMARLIDDLLDISRITRGKIEVRKQTVDLAAVLTSAVQAVTPLLEARQHQLTVDRPPGRIPLLADPTRLEQIVVNLLNNAAKYTEPGGKIWLSATVERAEVVLRVRDTGVGIAPDMLPRVFDPFAQADQSLARSQGGLGIGLTLVRGLVDLHGGSVEAHSAGLGQGSEFVVRLPVGREEPAVAGQRDPACPTSGCRLLLVEDNADSREMMRELLELRGHEVELAADGSEALESARRRRPDAAIIDIGLPGIDGYEVADQLRKVPDGEAMFLIALTGYGQPQDRRRALAAGFDAHLVKPVDIDELLRLLEQVPSIRQP